MVIQNATLQHMIRRIQNHIESFFKTDISYIVKGGFWLSIGKGVSSVSSLLLVLTFGNILSKTDYGTYQYILSIAGILSVTTLPGMTTALKQSVAQGKEGVMSEMIQTSIRWGLIGSVSALSLGGYYFFQGNTLLAAGFFMTGIFLPLSDSIAIAPSIFIGRKEFKISSLYGSLFKILQTIAVIISIYITHNIGWILFTYFTSALVTRTLLLIIIFTFHTPNKETNPSALSYGKHLSLMNILGALSTQADKIIMWHFLGPIALATYSFALSPIVQIQSWFKSVETLAFPKFASAQPEVLKKTLPNKLLKLFILIVPIVIFYILLAPWLYSKFLPQYSSSVIYSQTLALILLFLPQKLLSSSITAQAQKKSLYILTTATPLSRIVTLIICIPLFGIWGAVAATMFPYMLGLGMSTYFFFKIK